MIIRSAILEGTVNAPDQPEFDRYMKDEVVPVIGTFPGIRKVELRRINEADEEAPSIYMIFDLHFDNLDAMNAALASDTRHRVREQIKKGMAPFEGRVYHIVFDKSV